MYICIYVSIWKDAYSGLPIKLTIEAPSRSQLLYIRNFIHSQPITINILFIAHSFTTYNNSNNNHLVTITIEAPSRSTTGTCAPRTTSACRRLAAPSDINNNIYIYIYAHC